jgi:transcriptional regulator with XRE-family HTH domain
MHISPSQCRAARALFAMSQQELANASGVSLRTISSFEDASDRLPTAANLAAIQVALQRLGVAFRDAGVEWFSPFSETQTRVILVLQARNGPSTMTSPKLIKETGCGRADLEFLAQRQIVTGIDGSPTLTAIGLHIQVLLRDQESRKAARQAFHGPTVAVFRIEEDGTLSILFDKHVPEERRDEVMAGAREALRRHRERDPRLGNFVWR